MDRNGLLLGVAAVLSGVGAVMLVAGVIVNPFFLLAALPFAAAAYLLWFQASGQLADRIRREAAAGNLGADRGGGRDVGFDAGPFGGFESDRRSRERERARRTRRTQRNRQRARTNAAPSQPNSLSAAEARRILDVDPSTGEDDLKAAYRRKAKQHHPDTDSGDEETFKKVSQAYETLSE